MGLIYVLQLLRGLKEPPHPDMSTMFKIMAWNVRGLNTLAKRAEIAKVIKSHKPTICILVETKVNEDNKDRILQQSFRKWNHITNYEFHENGRIWLLFKDHEVDVDLIQKSSQMITCRVNCKIQKRVMRVSAVYAKNNQGDRKELWATINQLKTNMPRLVLGDFNCVRFGLVVSPNFEAMEELNQYIQEVDFEDLKWWGQKLTWWNKQVGKGNIECKLDRPLCNGEWNGCFPWLDANFTLPRVSYHCPCVVVTDERKQSWTIPFKFFDMWIHYKEFQQVVREAWNIQIAGDPLFQVVKKMKAVKLALKKWNIETFGQIDVRVQ